MDSKVTVSVRSLLLAGVMLLGLLAAYLLGSAGGPGTPAGAAPQQAAQTTDRRTVVMNGTGTATAVPDQLSFTLSVGVTRSDLDAALAEANATMKSVFATLQDNGVAKEDVQTTGLSMDPVYVYPDNSAPVITGYRVSERARVTVKDLGQGGKAITAAVAAGGNSVRVGNINLEVGDPDAALKTAREAAVTEATTKAQEYADATGQSLGDVVSLREVSAGSPQRFAYPQALDAITGSRAVPIRAGTDDLKVTVAIVWEFS